MWSLHFMEPGRSLADALQSHYDFGLVALSLVVAVGASYASFLASERLRSSDGPRQAYAWTAAGALALGGGVWSMHFIGMLALQLPVQVGYETLPTLLSLIPVMLASGLAIVPYRGRGVFDSMLMRSLLLGSGIGTMHYVGMMAMRMQDVVMRYDLGLFVLSVVLAVALAYAALWIRLRAQRQLIRGDRQKAAVGMASLVMGLAISGMHYTGMASVYYFAQPTDVLVGPTWEPSYFALIIMLVMCGLLVILITSVYFSRNADLLKKLTFNQQRLQALFDTVPNGLLTVDQHGRVRSCNPAAERMFGIDAAALSGQRLDRLLVCRSADKAVGSDCDLRLIDQCVREKRRIDIEGMRSDGGVFPISVLASIVEDGASRLYVVVINDITQRKAFEASLTRQKEDAEATSKAKSTFLAAMSHEIRTPMNGVVGMVDVLRQTPLSPSQQDTLKTIKESAFSLLRILDDILDFSKIEAGKMAFEQVPMSLERTIESVRETLLPLAERKGIELLLLVDPSVPPLMLGDPVRVRQILFNLIGNAIKFTGESADRAGVVLAMADYQTTDDGQGRVRVSIVDNGIGIAPEVQQTLFNSFVQAENSTTRRFGGTGLGLVISKRLLDMMGGGIEMASTAGVGSRFTFHLPAGQVQRDEARFETDLAGLRVLLVSSRPPLARVLTAQLADMGATAAGCDPDQLDSYLAGRDAWDDERMVLVIDGGGDRSAVRRLRAELRLRLADLGPRFVMLDNGKRRSARMEDGDSVVLDLNYMSRTGFLRAVAAVVGRSSIEPPPMPGDDAFEPADARARERHGRYRVLVAEDNATNREVMSRQMELLGYRVVMAHDGLQALALWREGGFDLVLTDCHMPELDGYGLARQIRDQESPGERIPIVAITADALRGTEQRCLDSGMDDYLTKPVQLKDLAPMLDKWLTGAPVTPLAAVPDEPSRAVVDAGFLRRVMGIDDPVMLDTIYRDFLTSGQAIVADITTQAQAGNAPGVGAHAHKLKSSARTVGANDVADCCERLEQAAKQADWDVLGRDSEAVVAHFHAVECWILNRQEQAGSAT